MTQSSYPFAIGIPNFFVELFSLHIHSSSHIPPFVLASIPDAPHTCKNTNMTICNAQPENRPLLSTGNTASDSPASASWTTSIRRRPRGSSAAVSNAGHVTGQPTTLTQASPQQSTQFVHNMSSVMLERSPAALSKSGGDPIAGNNTVTGHGAETKGSVPSWLVNKSPPAARKGPVQPQEPVVMDEIADSANGRWSRVRAGAH